MMRAFFTGITAQRGLRVIYDGCISEIGKAMTMPHIVSLFGAFLVEICTPWLGQSPNRVRYVFKATNERKLENT